MLPIYLYVMLTIYQQHVALEFQRKLQNVM